MRRLFFVVLLLMLVGYVLTGVRQIRPGERAVVRRFGRVHDEKPAPGLWWGLPWGMDRVDRVPISMVRRLEIGYQPEGGDESASVPAGQLLTGDHNLVNIRVAVEYAVRPGEEDIVDYVLQADRIDDVVAHAAEAVMVEWAAGQRVDDLLIEGKTELPRVLIARTQQRLRDYRLGVQIGQVSVLHLLPPAEVKFAFDDVTSTHASIRTREEDALRQARQKLGAAQSDRYAREQQAATYKERQRLDAQADGDRFEQRRQQYERLRQTNANILAGMWWDQMTRLYTSMKETGRLDFLDNHLGGDGLDITVMPPLPPKR